MLDAFLLKQITHIFLNYLSHSLNFYCTFLLSLILYFANSKRRDVVKKNIDLLESSSNFTFQHKVEKFDIGVSPHFHERKQMATTPHIFGTLLAFLWHHWSNYPLVHASVSNKVLPHLLGVPTRGSLGCFYKKWQRLNNQRRIVGLRSQTRAQKRQ